MEYCARSGKRGVRSAECGVLRKKWKACITGAWLGFLGAKAPREAPGSFQSDPNHSGFISFGGRHKLSNHAVQRMFCAFPEV